MNNYSASQHQPSIMKFSQDQRMGIQSHKLQRHAIGYVINGTKNIYYGDVANVVEKGSMFYLSSGSHYTEDVPEGNKPFEQVVVYYTPEQLSRILTHLTMNYELIFTNDHACDNCQGRSHVVYPAWNTVKNFFTGLTQNIKDGMFQNDPTAENLKMTELIYMLLSRPDCCIKSKILEHTDQMKESFEQTMYRNIFNDVSIEELARQSNRSLTSFKKEFKKHFHEPPHKWFIRQRLMHSRLLLISTSKSISEIGTECNFPNTSHFIKLFKKEFTMTPANYRNKHNEKVRNEKLEHV